MQVVSKFSNMNSCGCGKAACCLTNTWSDLVCLRLLYCMSEQFSQLKMILRSSSTSTSTSIPIVKEETFDTSDNSDASSTDSDFTFPAPAPASANFSSFKPNALQLIVQDLSATEIAGQLIFFKSSVFRLSCLDYFFPFFLLGSIAFIF